MKEFIPKNIEDLEFEKRKSPVLGKAVFEALLSVKAMKNTCGKNRYR